MFGLLSNRNGWSAQPVCPPHFNYAAKCQMGVVQPTTVCKQNHRRKRPHRRLYRRNVRQDMYQLKFSGRMLVPRRRLVGVRMDNRYPVDHMGVGKQRDATYIRNKQYRQKISRYREEQSIHLISFYGFAKICFLDLLSKTTVRHTYPAGYKIDHATTPYTNKKNGRERDSSRIFFTRPQPRQAVQIHILSFATSG